MNNLLSTKKSDPNPNPDPKKDPINLYIQNPNEQFSTN
jgi:hypothetical protein